jgi:hypothetical protein
METSCDEKAIARAGLQSKRERERERSLKKFCQLLSKFEFCGYKENG